MVIFIDTSALYALLDADDRHHKTARAVWEGWLEHPPLLVCSSYILLESVALIQRCLGMEAVRLFQEEMVPLFHIHWIEPELHASAMSALLAARRRHISLVDWTSFELMRRLGIRTAFAFDRHFAEQGFEMLPPVQSPGPLQEDETLERRGDGVTRPQGDEGTSDAEVR